MTAPVSVVVRTSGRPLLLQRALRSVLAQTHEDWSMTVVVDGATDVAVGEALTAAGAADDPRVRVLENSREPGRSGAANAGVAADDSEYVVLHDDDDSWAPTFLETTLAHLAGHPADLAVATRTAVVTESIGPRGLRELGREVLAADQHSVSLVSVVRGNYVPPISLVLRRKALREVGDFDPLLPVLEDWDLLLRLLARGPVGFLDGEPLAFWHQRPEATGVDANSITAEADAHRLLEPLIRDRYMRLDLDHDDHGVRGMGVQLALAAHLAGLEARTASAVGGQARLIEGMADSHRQHLDVFSNSLRQHIDVVNTDLRLEVGRLRGEIMVARELLKELSEQVEAATELVDTAMTRTGKVLEVARATLRQARQSPAQPEPERRSGRLRRHVGAALRRSGPGRPVGRG